MDKTTHCAFFSYSRDDSEFALRLAKDLKAARAIVWLDQLDIRPGQHWDSAIEEAVQSCPNMLLILSPSSVASQNVMDEVSFAIEEGKLIIPILYRTCKIPLRLRRLQYVDARLNYDKAFDEMRRLLAPDEEAQVARETRLQLQQAHVASEQKGFSQPNDKPPREDLQSEAPTQASNHTRTRWVAGIVISLALIIGSIWHVAGPRTPRRSPPPSGGPLNSVDTQPARMADQTHKQSSGPLKPASESEQQSVPSTTEWAKRFVAALAGSSVTRLRPFFDETVAPYYGIPTAHWDAIEKDKQSFFWEYPTIQYTILGEPREISRSDDRAVVEVDMQYYVVRRDGRKRQGVSHLSMELHLVEAEWKLAAIRERVSTK